MADWQTWLRERKQRGEAEWDRLTDGRKKLTMREWDQTYGAYKQRRKTERLERNHARMQRIFGKWYQPHMLKHPTEDREVTYRQWKHAQVIVMERERRLYQHMRMEHSLIIRAMIFISHPEEHISPIDRLIMKYRGQTREERLKRKAEFVAFNREARKFWKLFTESKTVQSAIPYLKRFAHDFSRPAHDGWNIVSTPLCVTIQFLRRTKLSGMALVAVGTFWTLMVLLGPLLFLDMVPLGPNSMVCIHEACIPLDFVMLGFWVFTLVGFFAERQKLEHTGWMETLNQWMFRCIYAVLLVGIPVFVVFLWSR